MKRTCSQWGKEFELSNSEIGFYKKRKLSLPKRCKECRDKNKKGKQDGSNENPEQKRVDFVGTKEHASGKTRNTSGKVTNTGGNAGNTSVPKTQIEKNAEHSRGTAADTGDNKGKKKMPKLAAILVCAAAILYYLITGQLPQTDVPKQNENTAVQEAKNTSDAEPAEISYTFRSEKLFEEHYEKHGIEMGFATAEDYLEGANLVIADPDALHKIEAEDGDDIYFLEDTNEFVVVSTDGYIRTYFEPEDGIEYYERQ